MKKVLKISVLLSLSLLLLPVAFSCTQTAEKMVTQEEYDALKVQLSTAEAKIAGLEAKQGEPKTEPGELPLKDETAPLKDEIASLKAKIEGLGSEITELDKQNDVLAQEKTSLVARYAELNVKYGELQETLAAQAQPEVITEEQIENEIMRLINQERVKAGVPEFVLGHQLYNQAKQNSRAMAASGKMETDQAVFYQEVFWAAGYDSVNAIVKGAMLTFKINQYRYEHGALLVSNKYGAVGAYKSGEIIYITFMAASFP